MSSRVVCTWCGSLGTPLAIHARSRSTGSLTASTAARRASQYSSTDTANASSNSLNMSG